MMMTLEEKRPSCFTLACSGDHFFVDAISIHHPLLIIIELQFADNPMVLTDNHKVLIASSAVVTLADLIANSLSLLELIDCSEYIRYIVVFFFCR